MNRQASLGVPSSVQSSLSNTREGISKDLPPPPPPLASKKKITSERGGSGQELIRRVF